ncbi:MAG: hypothetical protein ABSF71_30860 [Terriglobia bacterium]
MSNTRVSLRVEAARVPWAALLHNLDGSYFNAFDFLAIKSIQDSAEGSVEDHE